jgi:hypothetical protein
VCMQSFNSKETETRLNDLAITVHGSRLRTFYTSEVCAKTRSHDVHAAMIQPSYALMQDTFQGFRWCTDEMFMRVDTCVTWGMHSALPDLHPLHICTHWDDSKWNNLVQHRPLLVPC